MPASGGFGVRRWSSVTGTWGSGRRSGRCTRTPMSNDAGTTGSSTCWTRCRSAPRSRKGKLRTIAYAERLKEAEQRRRSFQSWARGEGLQRAAELIEEDWERTVSYYGYPRAHWRHLRTTNVIESPFAGVASTDRRSQAIQERSERHRGDLEDAAGGRDEVPEAERAGATPRRVGGSLIPRRSSSRRSSGAGRCLTRLHTY